MNNDKIQRLKKVFEDDYKKLQTEQSKYQSGTLDFAFVGGQMDRIQFILLELKELLEK